MPSYAIDGIRQAMSATGITEKVMEWVETPEGKRRPGDVQARDENTGMPLWGVEVLFVQTSFGRRSTVTAKVTVGHEDEPKVAPLSPVGFNGLRVEVRINKAGGLQEFWSAESLMEVNKGGSTGTSAAASGKAA